MYFAGVDVGSLAIKVCLLDGEAKLVAYNIEKTMAKVREASEEAFKHCLGEAGLKPSDVAYIVATGYGRNLAASSFANEKITEITCHSRGARFLFPKCYTVIDVGGQDSKAIRLDDTGRVLKFAMNDKCAAGTGRFLEVMAEALGVKLEEMGEISLKSERKAPITSTCTVFAESEVISLLASGENPVNIIAGLHEAIAKRISSLAKQVGIRSDVVMTGGVAKNVGVVRALEEEIKEKIHVPQEPQIVGALGAALIAREKASQKAT
ncbi:MAG: 2-hydroxyglutaryl-CoA dehydratase [Candidatus Hecatellales archaeon]|nr:MAG: 2-hydroxyglutaryl-CoA dehydratase [Candidatus Hecatellales archaeon]